MNERMKDIFDVKIYLLYRQFDNGITLIRMIALVGQSVKDK